MEKLVSPTKQCLEIDAPSGRRYRAKDGIYHVADGDAAALRKAGATVATLSGPTARGLGFRCGACGFGAFVNTCGRCGGVCEREA